MDQLNKKQIDLLIKMIKNPEDVKKIKQFLEEELNETEAGKSGNPRESIMKKKSAKEALNTLWRIGRELGKHKLMDGFFDLFD